MPNQSRRPSFPGYQPRWDVPPEMREAMDRLHNDRQLIEYLADPPPPPVAFGSGGGGGGGVGAPAGAGLFHSIQSDPRNFTRNFSLRNDIETDTPPLAADAKANPRDTIIGAAAAVLDAEVNRCRWVQAETRTPKVDTHIEDRLAVVRHNMARELAEKIKPDLVIRGETDHWRGISRFTCDTLVMTPDQLKAIIERVTSGIIAQCVANGWIK